MKKKLLLVVLCCCFTVLCAAIAFAATDAVTVDQGILMKATGQQDLAKEDGWTIATTKAMGQDDGKGLQPVAAIRKTSDDGTGLRQVTSA